jgi:hypothetical protein
VLRRNLRDIFVFRLMQFWGTYRGFAQGSVTSQLKQTFYYPGGRSQTATRDQYMRERQRIDYSSVPEEEIHDTIG